MMSTKAGTSDDGVCSSAFLPLPLHLLVLKREECEEERVMGEGVFSTILTYILPLWPHFESWEKEQRNRQKEETVADTAADAPLGKGGGQHLRQPLGTDLGQL